MEFTLLAAAAIAGAAAYTMLWWEARHGNAARCTGNLWEAGVVSAVAGIFIGRIVAMLIDGVNPIAHPMDVILVRSGVSTVGASLGALAVFAWLVRKEPVTMADGISAAALAGLAGWQAGCLVRGTCLGTGSDLPWAIAQAGSDVARHPVGVYAALMLGASAVGLAWWKAFRRPPAGAPAAIAVIAAAGTRLVVEPLQPSISGGPVWFYATGLVVGIVALVWSVVRR
ncbi:MAG: prolipoprotein diacylglyceryl transferase family protein [Acidimicrobiia bacterium]